MKQSQKKRIHTKCYSLGKCSAKAYVLKAQSPAWHFGEVVEPLSQIFVTVTER